MCWKNSNFKQYFLLISILLLSSPLLFAQGDRKVLGGDFTLQSFEGPISLHHLQGKVVLLFFGYTGCPNVCPISLSRMEGALSLMNQDTLKQVQALFISLDPEYDTLEKLKQYTGYFHPNISGVTGKPETIASIAKQYGVVYERKKLSNSALGYVINHSLDIFLIDPNGKLEKTLPHDASSKHLRNHILDLLKKS